MGPHRHGIGTPEGQHWDSIGYCFGVPIGVTFRATFGVPFRATFGAVPFGVTFRATFVAIHFGVSCGATFGVYFGYCFRVPFLGHFWGHL